MPRYRIGRGSKVNNTTETEPEPMNGVYWQISQTALDDDLFVGSMTSVENAKHIVEMANEGLKARRERIEARDTEDWMSRNGAR